MNKYYTVKIFIVICALFLFGCESLPYNIDTSTDCKFNVEGLDCTREQVWQMQDNGGQTFEADNTKIWFKSHSDCEKFVKDKKNRDLIENSDTGYIGSCGVDGSKGSAADVYNYYIYSDGISDGDFYYKLNVPPFRIKGDENKSLNLNPYSSEEYFVAMFTSKSALEIFEAKTKDLVDPISVLNANRIVIKRAYSKEDIANMQLKTPAEEAAELDKELSQERNPLKTVAAFIKYSGTTDNKKMLYAQPIVGQGNNDKKNEKNQIFAVTLTEETPVKKECLIGSGFGYIDSSDECIIARRNASVKPTSVGYFNYKKYLPINSVIKTDEDFILLVDAYLYLIEHHYIEGSDRDIKEKYGRDCELAEELTRSEKKQCEQEKENFIKKFVLGTAPMCKKSIPKKYEKFRQETLHTTFIGHSEKSQKDERNRRLRIFGYVNLCIPGLIQ